MKVRNTPKDTDREAESKKHQKKAIDTQKKTLGVKNTSRDTDC